MHYKAERENELNNDQLINQNSGDSERYTDEDIMILVREFFGEIDLDPASCAEANKIVKAVHYFTKENDAFTEEWIADKLWLNHPFTRGEKACKIKCKKKICNDEKYKHYRGYCIDEDIPSNLDWINKLLIEHSLDNINESLNITFVSSSEAWCQKLLDAGIQCFIAGRTKYKSPNGGTEKSPPKGSMITYIGSRKEEFKRAFSKIGSIKK